jgi:hypothetical protein
MNKTLPDKWVRKAVYDEVNNIVVSGKTIPCYDSRITGRTIPQHYILMTTQTNLVDKANKCEYRWESSILLDIITTYKSSGNTGSRLLADNIADSVRNLTDSLTLGAGSGLSIISQIQSFPNDISTITTNENIFRKLIRIEFVIQ